MDGGSHGLTIMFVDVSGSTVMYESLGDEGALARVGACLQHLTELSVAHGGRVVKTSGDGALCAFAIPDHAVLAASGMMEAVARERQVDAAAPGVHIGCHFGSVIESANDLFGDAVNVTSRIAGLAKVGQIIVTQDLVARLSPDVAARARQFARVAVKGKRDDVGLWEFLWQEVTELTTLSTHLGPMPQTSLTLRLDRRELALGHDGACEATFGRDASCDFVIDHQRTSRAHARIELRYDKFVIVDHSSNGTWVRIGNEAPIMLHREELILSGAGEISFGRTPNDAGVVRVAFEVR